MIATRRLYNGLDPVRQLADRRCDLVLNLSASPWHFGKGDFAKPSSQMLRNCSAARSSTAMPSVVMTS